MKNKIIYAIIALLLVCILNANAYQVTPVSTDSYEIADTSSFLVASIINQMPDPAEPGRYVELRFKIENIGTQNLNNVQFELVPRYPFYFDNPADANQTISSIWGGQAIKNNGSQTGVILYYKLRADNNAVAGDNEIELRYKTQKDFGWTYFPKFKIRVQVKDPVLSLESIKSAPEKLTPGEISIISIKLKNNADAVLRFININLGLVMAASTGYVELPFTPVGESNLKTIYQLQPGEEKTVEFSLMADPDAEAKPYKIPLMISYYDLTGMMYNKSNIIGLIIGSEPELSVDVDANELKKGANSKVSIRLVNKGLTNIKFLTSILADSKDYEIISSKEVYVGKIDSDDYQTADYTLNVKKTKDNKVALPLTIEYMDANNQKYTEQKELSVAVSGSGSHISFGMVVFIVICAVIGYFVYRRWEKKQEAKKKR